MAELATVLNRNINYVKDLFLNEMQNPHVPITDFKCLQNAVKRGGKRVKIIGNLLWKTPERIHSEPHL